jgi:hypothetical protein
MQPLLLALRPEEVSVARSLLCALPVVLIFTAPAPSNAQVDTPSTIPAPVFTITAGVGNAMGWYGAQGEGYFADGRLSAFGGLGYTFPEDDFGASGLTLAAGLRGYTAGRKHRGFAEVSLCQVSTFSDPIEPRRFYGPCGQLGYQFASRGGLTAMLSLGVGYALGTDDLGQRAQPLVGLGLGYTWRRRNEGAH